MTKYRDFEVFGGVKEFVNYRGSEAIVHGPAETGKTLGALFKLHICATEYPNASIVICRKTLASTYSTVVVMFQKKVLGENSQVQAYGGEKPQWFDYPNGSRIWITGMDKSSKVLSSEHDIIFVNQVEELALGEWETLTTRTTGRAGNMPYSQTIGDCNPAWPTHWIYNRSSLRLFHSRHSENPMLFDQKTGEITKQGLRTMNVLEALTGLRRTRLLDGKAARAEGVIFEDWDEGVHLIYADAVPRLRRYVAGQDWGYTHPGVLGVWGLDSDGRMYLVAQIYRTKKLIDWWAKQAQALDEEFGIEAFICDPSEPAYIMQYQQAGLNAVAGFNPVRPGINAVQERLAKAGDGGPRLFIVHDSLRQPDIVLQFEKRPHATEQEFPGYVWANKKAREQPVKEFDDGCLIAGTLVNTNRGEVPIENVRIGDRALTRNGYKTVVNTGMTNSAAEVMTVSFSNGASLTGTLTHPIWIEGKGFLPLHIVRYDDIIQVATSYQGEQGRCNHIGKARLKSLLTKGSSFVGIQNRKVGPVNLITYLVPTTEKRGLTICIGKYGKILMALYHRAMKFITRITTHLITRLTTLYAYLKKNTMRFTRRNTRLSKERRGANGSCQKFIREQLIGTRQRQAGNGTVKWHWRHGRVENIGRFLVSIAKRNFQREQLTTRQSIAQTSASLPPEGQAGLISLNPHANSAATSSRMTKIKQGVFARAAVQFIIVHEGKQAVYNLQVDNPDGHGEYYANNVLVHNCDMTRYTVAYVDGLGQKPEQTVRSLR